VLFRNVVGVVLPMVTVGMAVLWTFAVIATVGTPLSMVSGTLPVVLLAIGIADSVHLVSEYQEQLAAGKKKLDALSDGVRAVFVPCLFTSVTTSLGFLGMLVIRVRPIHDFGLYASIGTMLAFVATFTLVPAVLSLLPAPRVRNDIGGAVSDRLTARVFRVVSAHRRLVLGVSLGGLLLGVVGLPLVQVSANTYKFLPATNPAIRATDFIEATIGGVNTMEVMVSARDISSQEPLKNVQALEEIQALQRKLAAFPQVEATLSPVDFLSAMNRTFHEDREEYERIPESRELVGQLMLMYEMDAPDGEFYDYFNFDMTKARMTIRTSMSADHENSDLIAAVREASKGFESIEAVPTGTVVLLSNIQYHMLVGMIRGFCVAFFCVGLSMTLLLRNLRHALLAMIPGALPIVFIVGMTGWLGMKLGANSAMMGNIALGIAVDNAIHMLTRYRRLRHEGVVAHEAIEHASTVVGRPVLFTTLVLCAGFLVLCLSATIPNQRFGLLTALVLAGSLLGSVGTLPATILVMEEYFGKGPEEPSQQAKPDNGDASVEHSEAA
jgi:predicted RND superfamily exporter protein